MTEAKITGRHVAIVFVRAFSVIIGVNLVLATSAVRTFPGLEVKNSYVASQAFEGARAAQLALGWDVMATVENGEVLLSIQDVSGPVAPEITRATFGRATHVGDDRELQFAFDGQLLRASAKDLAPGNWNLRLEAVATDGTVFQQRIIVRVMS